MKLSQIPSNEAKNLRQVNVYTSFFFLPSKLTQVDCQLSQCQRCKSAQNIEAFALEKKLSGAHKSTQLGSHERGAKTCCWLVKVQQRRSGAFVLKGRRVDS